MTGIKDLLAWDGGLRRDSSAALKYYYWRKQLIQEHGRDAVNEAAQRIDYHMAALEKRLPSLDLAPEEYEAAAYCLAKAMAQLKTDHGSLAATYGDTFRVGRDGQSWPLGGGGGDGLTTLRNIGYGQERPDHTRWGNRGQTSTQVILLSQPIQSWTCPPIGQSDRPDSSHYTDQAQRLFSPRKLKPTWWLPQDLAQHIESRQVLEPRR
jgi:acyl-homoserine lactone acylase PvdQ